MYVGQQRNAAAAVMFLLLVLLLVFGGSSTTRIRFCSSFVVVVRTKRDHHRQHNPLTANSYYYQRRESSSSSSSSSSIRSVLSVGSILGGRTRTRIGERQKPEKRHTRIETQQTRRGLSVVVSSSLRMSATTRAATTTTNNEHDKQHQQQQQHQHLTRRNDYYEEEDSMIGDSEDDFVYHHLYDIQRVFCLSDLHTDHKENMEWVRERMSKSDISMNDLIIVAGDISHNILTMKETIQILAKHCHVFFIAGNHEAWTNRTEIQNGRYTNSIEKIDDHVYDMCRKMNNVYVDPVFLDTTTSSSSITSSEEGNNHHYPVWILPLQSWYDGTLSFNDALCEDLYNWPWMDFYRCIWPIKEFPPEPKDSCDARIPTGLVDYYHQRNNKNIEAIKRHIINNSKEKRKTQQSQSQSKPISVITVSHFLPNQQSLPDWKDLKSTNFEMNWLDHGASEKSAKFAKVAGSMKLDEQVRSLLSATQRQSMGNDDNDDVTDDNANTSIRNIHVFGHSHRPKDFILNEIRYIHHPLGQPRERYMHMVSPNVDLLHIWNVVSAPSNNNEKSEATASTASVIGGMIPGETILRYWDEKGGGRSALFNRLRLEKYAHNPNNSKNKKVRGGSTTTAAATGNYRK